MLTGIFSFFCKNFYPFKRGQWRIARFLSPWLGGYRVTTLKSGVKMLLNFTNAVDRVIGLFGQYDSTQIKWLNSKADNVKSLVFLDIGANIGIYSLEIAKAISMIEIHAFEPDKRNLTILCANLTINSLSKAVYVHPIVVGDKSETVEFVEAYDPSNLNTGKSHIFNTSIEDSKNLELQMLPQIKLDDEFPFYNKTILIKIDVEGHELKVIEGMKRLLTENSCYIVIEIFDSNFTIVNHLLEKLSYHIVTQFGNSDYGYTKL